MDPIETTPSTNWDDNLAVRAKKMKSSTVRELLKVAEQPGIISFGGGFPAAELFPLHEFRESCEYVLQNMGGKALQYGATEGFTPLREYIADKMRQNGVAVDASNILVTAGSQQALDLIGRIFVDPGDVILTESPTYLGALQAWNAYEPKYATVPLDDNGMVVDKLEAVLKANEGKVKFIYALPNFQNPAGTTMSLERRVKLVQIAAKYHVPIVEDDPYGELRFEGNDIASIASMHKENVIYLGTLSKTLAPGLRIGWVCAPEKVIGKLVQAKQGADLHTGSFVQMVAADICRRGLLKPHVKLVRDAYRERRDAMLDAMKEYFPKGVTWTKPEGGLFLWVRLPEHVDTTVFLQKALKEKVAFVPGVSFFPDGTGKNTMRLNYSFCEPSLIREGIKRLGKALMEDFG